MTNGPSTCRWGLMIALVSVASVVAPWPADAASTDQFAVVKAGSTATVDHVAWSKLLKVYVKADATGLNRVDYAAWKRDGHASLKAYLTTLQAIDPAQFDRKEQFAFWANLYNARTVDIVLDKYPVKSIRDISLGGGLKSLVTGGPWQAEVVKVAGVGLSLDDIEHKILRAHFKDARVHYALNCASYGCPNLQDEAFTGATLDATLDAAAAAFINHPRGISVRDGVVKASSIFSWFEVDFGGSAAAVLDHVRKYASPALKQQLEKTSGIANYDYDWTLNEVKR